MNKSTLQTSDVLRKLHTKFSTNFNQATGGCALALDRVDIKIRAVAECGAELAKMPGLTTSQLQLTNAAEEVFADLVTSVYLACIGLDRSAQMVLRRALELGLAVVYLWDLPHLFWGWKHGDYDLSFSEMLEHLESLNYRTYLEKTERLAASDVLVDVSAAKRIYRMTSNTVHGKVTTHKVLAGDGFNHNPDQWNAHLLLADDVATLLLSLWFRRFSCIKSAVRSALPSYDRISS